MNLSSFKLAGLPGMPATDRGVRLLADREGWAWTTDAEGRRVYPLEALPVETRAHLRGLESTDAIEGRVLLSSRSAEWTKAPANHRSLALRRTQILLFERTLRHSGATGEDAYGLILERFDEPRRNVCRWRATVGDAPLAEWPALLLPAWKSTAKRDEIDPDAWDWLLSDYLRPAQPALTACYRRLVEVATSKGWRVPSLQSVKRRLRSEVEPTVRLFRREGARAFEQIIPAQRRDKSDLGALGHVNADGHRFDVFVRWPAVDPAAKPRIGRPILVAWQDVYSGKILGWRLDETENADAVRLAFADMVRDFGIPEQATVDNGHAFASKRMTGGVLGRHRFKYTDEEPDGIYLRFGVEIHFALPYHGQAKPIERAFRDLCETIAKHPLCAGAYTGNRPTNKPDDYGTASVDYSEFRVLVAREIAAHNARTGRRSPIAAGRSFDEVFAESYAARPIRRATEAQIHWLLLPIEGVRISKDEACITLLGNRFGHPALFNLRGQKVQVRFDPYDVQAGVYVFANGALEPLCHATCIERVGFRDTDSARRTMRARRALVTAEKKKAEALGTLPVHLLAHPELPTERKKAAKVIALRFDEKARPPATERQVLAKAGDEMLLRLGQFAQAELARSRGVK